MTTPHFPPGTGNSVAPAVGATWVFTPTPNAAATVSLYNTGRNTVFVGKSGVKQADGLPVQPGNKPVRLQNIGYSLYACSDVTIGSSVSTTAAAYTAGTTSIVTAGSISTSAGSTLVVGNTTNTAWEAVNVTSVSASGTTIGTSALVSDHITASPVYSATALGGNLFVQAGVV